MGGGGVEFLRQSLDVLVKQTFKDFEIVLSDHSQNDAIEKLCQQYSGRLDIHYHKNKNQYGNLSANINNAIKKARGRLLKILFQDDSLYSPESLNQIINNFDLANDRWLIMAGKYSIDGINCYQQFIPKYNHKIHLGENTIGSLSVLTIKNDQPLLFDEKLGWLMDCDYYKRCYRKFGAPRIASEINIIKRVTNNSMSDQTASENLRSDEYEYLLKKYKEVELLKQYKEKRAATKVKLTPRIFVIKAAKRIRRLLRKSWSRFVLNKRWRMTWAYHFNNKIKIFFNRSAAQNGDGHYLDSAKRILLIYSRKHFDPENDRLDKKLAASSAANLARNIYQGLKEKNKEVVYVDQGEYKNDIGKFDLIIGTESKNFYKYAKNNPRAKKNLFLVNSHPLYRLRALLNESERIKKNIPLGEYVPPSIFLRCLKRADRLILIGNQFVKNSYIKYGVQESKIKLINSGVNTEQLTPRREFYAKDKIKFCFVGSDLGIRKGLFRIIEFWKELNKDGRQEIELTIMGGTLAFKKEIDKFISEYNNVQCWGWVDSTDIIYKTILQSHQIIINFSIEEGQVGCVLEAMACGCIPIITEESGIPIMNKIDGIIIKAENFQAGRVAQEVARLLKNKTEMEELSIGAREYILANHTWNLFKNNLANIL